jgi:hypothetical protein
VSPLGQAIVDQRAVLDAMKPFSDVVDQNMLASEGVSIEDAMKLGARAKVMVPAWERALARLVSLCDGYSGEPGV